MLASTSRNAARAMSRFSSRPVRLLCSSVHAATVPASLCVRSVAPSGASRGVLRPSQAHPPLHPRGFAATAAAAAAPDGAAASPSPSLVDRIKGDMKEAMKAKDQARLDAIRFLNAAIKSREIELREAGGAVNDDEVIKVIQKLVKQRKDSIDSYKAGGRDDLVAKEQVELTLLESYLPAMLSAAEVEAVVVAVIAELNLSGPKAMGQVMKAVMARTGGRADNKTVSDLAKAKLAAK
ncbi:hypothetical protein HYH02_002260 [Chlamydomonas schloesseri]|uniref:GatB/YqeY domain-containing protein n=1 Tax=Chlamydomonas schloesseri TaxID=2026947 RepID=A0A836BAS0_9CHLO|nr:hypothetical protein HYH02_002260 [Chlamydomonas schloesseri]|eukprot:KAG2452917.1 hypothetical protein HYH02_002260 [Chlamydomonas schloesseri]